jgi:hydroxymethylpyrimidine/phosphomethylpyrimidine kinase
MSQHPVQPPAVLTFAGTDPTSGAGLQADLLTLASLGCHPLSVVTAVTTQDTRGVENVQVIDPRIVTKQAQVVLADIGVAAIKIGMVGSADNARAIAKVIARYPGVPMVLDPVLASGRGDALASDATRDALIEHLLPLATVITPNSLEARALAGCDLEDPLERAARILIDDGAQHVLITGTHELETDVRNALWGIEGLIREDSWERLRGEFHGSGCTLASAIAGMLANGLSVGEAVRAAQEYTWQSLANALRPGKGQSVPDRFFWVRQIEGGSAPVAVQAAEAATDITPTGAAEPAPDEVAVPAQPTPDEAAPAKPARRGPRRRQSKLHKQRLTALRGLYAITPDEADTAVLLDRVGQVLAGGARVVQYRNKTASPELRTTQAMALRELTRAHQALLIINDDASLTLAADADGVHLGRDDGDIAATRERIGADRLLGVSCYNDWALARKGLDAGADHVAFGAAFTSATKPEAVRAAPELYAQARAKTKAPIVAIGGIEPGNAKGLVDLGVDALAVITALFGSTDPKASAEAFAAMYAPAPAAGEQLLLKDEPVA